MSFSEHLRKIAKPIWEAQLTHPFVVALGKGTLPERKFKYYILQDARFLGDLARVFAAAAQKAPDSESAVRFNKLAEETIMVERSLHESHGKRWKMSPEQMTSVPMAPTNFAYTRHMLAVAATGSACEITVVALPCAWIYCLVGQHLLKKTPPRAGERHRPLWERRVGASLTYTASSHPSASTRTSQSILPAIDTIIPTK